MQKYELIVPCKVGDKVKIKPYSFYGKAIEVEVIRYEIQKFGKVKVVVQYQDEARRYGNQIVINIKTITIELNDFMKRIEVENG